MWKPKRAGRGKEIGLARFVTNEALSDLAHGVLGMAGARAPAAQATGPTVLFIHGHGGGAGVFRPLERSLRRLGFGRFAGWEYRSTGQVHAVASDLAGFVDSTLGHDGDVLVVAHSLGGIIARTWLQDLDGRRHVRALVTLSSPHRGIRPIPGAQLLPLLRELQPGSELIGSLEAGASKLSGLPCLSIVSSRDHFVHPWTNAMFTPARTVPISDVGHVGVLFSREVHQLVGKHLLGEPDGV